MVNLDTISLKFDTENIQDINMSKFNRVMTTEGVNGEIINDVRKCSTKNKILGINNIEVRKEFGKIDLSAKILGKDYYNLVNINTIDRVISNINKSGLIKLSADLPDKAEVLRCDVTNNLGVQNEVSKYVNSLQIYSYNDKYKMQSYRDQSIVFTRNVKSYKERQIWYDKFPELQRDKELTKVIRLDDFKNCLRVESNLTSFESIRKSFDVKDRFLVDILNSKSNPNLGIYERIKNEKEMGLIKSNIEYVFCKAEEMSFPKLEKEFGMQGIIKSFDYDYDLIKGLIKKYCKARRTRMRYYGKYRDKISDMKTEKERRIKYLEELEQLLRAA